MSSQRPRRELSPWAELGISLLVAIVTMGGFLALTYVVWR